MTRILMQSIVSLGLALLLGACATTDDSRVEAEFGEAVRDMVRLQTLDPDAEHRNAGAAPAAIDGAATEKVMDTYRNRASTQESISDDIVIGIGD